MLSSAAAQTVRNAYQLAAQYGHGGPGQEHLLLSLTGDPDAVAALLACGADPRIIHGEVDRMLPRLPERQTTDNPLERTVERAERFKPETPCDGACLLLALLVDRGASPATILRRHGVTRDRVVEHMVQRDVTARRRDKSPRRAMDASDPVKPGAPAADSALANWCIDLNAKAEAGRIDPVIGRDDAIARTIQILCRRTRTTRFWSVNPVSARPPSPRGWRCASWRAKCPRSCRTGASSRSTLGRWWRGPAIAATSRSG